jgi:SAM-dependent methyltransferase
VTQTPPAPPKFPGGSPKFPVHAVPERSGDRTLGSVGLYAEHVLPRLTNLLLGNAEFGRKYRARACAGLHGDVIELGFGSGLNLPYLPPEVTGIWTVEPSRVALELARSRMDESSVAVHTGTLDGARLDFPDDRFDGALSTMTLCTIPDVTGALAELRRVLKPGAAFHFAEHGLAADEKVARRQHRFEPMQKRFAGGCHLARDMEALVTAAGFEITELDKKFMKGPKPWSYMYVGTATSP